jgi:hypothetical protein
MTLSRCPEHGNLMLDLARGRLDDEQSLKAEAVREDCPTCARWWQETFNGDAFDVVDGAVADAISDFDPPARRRYRWLAVAAAAVLAVGVGASSMMWRNAQVSPAYAGDPVSSWDFENGSLDSTVGMIGDEPGDGENGGAETAMFAGDFESGSLAGWSTDS